MPLVQVTKKDNVDMFDY